MRFYITTPIYYINAEPHLGHAYTTMVADAVARAQRLLGRDVFFLTGTDEHGQKVARAAQKAGMEPRAFADRMAGAFRRLFSELNISNDDFIRTTEPRHYAASQEIWRRVRDNGFIYKSTYEGWYCTVDEVFVPETQLTADRTCPLCGSPVERLSEESYFFKLSEFEEPLLDHYAANPDFVTPDNRRNEMLSFIKAGLSDLSVSRTSFRWGIPVPDDPAHVMYVWFDALTNYITAVGFGSGEKDAAARFDKWWPADVHLMGKEIVRQHAVYWPAFLMAAKLPLPRQVVGHGWWLMEGAKMSKSRGNVVEPYAYARIFGVDTLRYFVLREMVFGQDASFGDEVFLTRYNADLANDLGNLVSRAATMIQRYRGGEVPTAGQLGSSERDLNHLLEQLIESVKAGFTSYQFAAALRAIWDVIASVNKLIVVREPWTIAKDPARKAELDAVLFTITDALRVIAALIEPAMPATTARIRAMLGVEREDWVQLKVGRLAPGTKLGPIEPLFPRIEHTVEELRAMANEEQGSGSGLPAEAPSQTIGAKAGPRGSGPGAGDSDNQQGAGVRDQGSGIGLPAEAPSQPTGAKAGAGDSDRISIDDFMRVELRTAKVLAAEKVPNSKKLIKMQIDVGTEQRTIVAGIAEAYEADALVGRTIVVVFNLKPAKLMGIESNGMVLAASPDGGKPTLVAVEGDIAPGTRVR
jgi:methionyl-tRNA synthetase